MPSNNLGRVLTDEMPIAMLTTASYQINSGTLIPGATNISEAQPFTDTVTVTGLATTDTRFAISPRDTVVIPRGLVIVNMVITAANTLAITWKNTTFSAISPPAAGVWSVIVLGNFIK